MVEFIGLESFDWLVFMVFIGVFLVAEHLPDRGTFRIITFFPMRESEVLRCLPIY